MAGIIAAFLRCLVAYWQTGQRVRAGRVPSKHPVWAPIVQMGTALVREGSSIEFTPWMVGATEKTLKGLRLLETSF